jgi:hypothetical protein
LGELIVTTLLFSFVLDLLLSPLKGFVPTLPVKLGEALRLIGEDVTGGGWRCWWDGLLLLVEALRTGEEPPLLFLLVDAAAPPPLVWDCRGDCEGLGELSQSSSIVGFEADGVENTPAVVVRWCVTLVVVESGAGSGETGSTLEKWVPVRGVELPEVMLLIEWLPLSVSVMNRDSNGAGTCDGVSRAAITVVGGAFCVAEVADLVDAAVRSLAVIPAASTSSCSSSSSSSSSQAD